MADTLTPDARTRVQAAVDETIRAGYSLLSHREHARAALLETVEAVVGEAVAAAVEAFQPQPGLTPWAEWLRDAADLLPPEYQRTAHELALYIDEITERAARAHGAEARDDGAETTEGRAGT